MGAEKKRMIFKCPKCGKTKYQGEVGSEGQTIFIELNCIEKGCGYSWRREYDLERLSLEILKVTLYDLACKGGVLGLAESEGKKGDREAKLIKDLGMRLHNAVVSGRVMMVNQSSANDIVRVVMANHVDPDGLVKKMLEVCYEDFYKSKSLEHLKKKVKDMEDIFRNLGEHLERVKIVREENAPKTVQ